MAEEPKITYLFGAGASAKALPTINGLPNSILEVHDYIKDNYNYDVDKLFTVRDEMFSALEAKELLLTYFMDLYNTSIKYSTIDTYAKQLFLSHQSNELNKLLFTLSTYFAIKQKISPKDSRYETFLISLLEDSIHTFPSNLKILSWNYDLQLEYAYSKISQSDVTNSFYKFLEKRNLPIDSFTTVKINGTCTFTDNFGSSTYSMIQNPSIVEPQKDDLDFILSYCYTFFKLRKTNLYQGRPGISYSWYCDNNDLTKWVSLHSQTTHLISIGYSFPFFNREIDRQIVRGMLGLKKIYIQDLYPQNIVSRFLSILPDYKERGVEIITVDNVDEFFLPPEL